MGTNRLSGSIFPYLRQKLQAIQADISILGEKGGDFAFLPIREESSSCLDVYDFNLL